MTADDRGKIYARVGYAAVAGLLVLGVLARLSRYLHAGPLRLDEAALVVNVMDRSYAELLRPLEWHQNSPFGFLFALKALTGIAGNGELAFRLIPFLSGLVSLGLFYALARTLARPVGGEDEGGSLWKPGRWGGEGWGVVFMAVLLLAVTRWQVFWSSEVRHYTTDVAITCMLYLFAVSILGSWRREEPGPVRIGILFATGAMVTWFSLSSIFILGGVGATLLWVSALKGRWKRAAVVAIMCVVWLGSFYLQLGIHERNIEARNLDGDIEATLGVQGFVPHPAESFLNVKWYREALELMFRLPGGLNYLGLGVFAFAAGCVAWWKSRREYLSLLLLPIVFGLVAAYLHRYPFWERYLLYLTPILYILMAVGVGLFTGAGRGGIRLVGIVLFVLLAMQPLYRGVRDTLRPYGENDFRKLAGHVETNWRAGDFLYLDWFEHTPFLYYREEFEFAGDAFELEEHFCEVVAGNEAYRAEFRSTRLAELLEAHERVWVLHGYDGAPVFDPGVGRAGELVEAERVGSTGVALHLIERREEPESFRQIP